MGWNEEKHACSSAEIDIKERPETIAGNTKPSYGK